MSASRSTSSTGANESSLHSCGDTALDQLIEDGTISKLKTCCSHDVYVDHNLSIQMADGIEIHSVSTTIIKSLTISFNGYAYTKEKTDAGSLLVMLSALTGKNFSPSEAALNFSYTKKSLGATAADPTIESNPAEFEAAFNTLPAAVKNALETRLKPRVPRFGILDAGDRKVPTVFL